jgi:hypothetical protein
VTAVLEGDGALVDSVAGVLSRRGIATSPTPNCPAAKARLDRRGTAIRVTVIDANGRRSERTLADVDAATSVIESWARQDLNAALLSGWTVEAAPPTEAPALATAAAPPPITPARRRSDPFTLVAAAELAIDFDGAAWAGGRAQACVRVGRACVGAIGRALANDARRGYDLLASADLPLHLGRRVTLAMGVGLGVGWFQGPYTQAEARSTFTARAVRGDGHAALAVALGRHVSLHAGLSVGLSPSAPAVIDATGDAVRTLDEPGGFVRGDVGLRIGAP